MEEILKLLEEKKKLLKESCNCTHEHREYIYRDIIDIDTKVTGLFISIVGTLKSNLKFLTSELERYMK